MYFKLQNSIRVIPAQAGIQKYNQELKLVSWIPACAGMTDGGSNAS
jgi:hypothetical protein